jgi:hypothetical protein
MMLLALPAGLGLLAYLPLRDPLDIDRVWVWFLAPIALGVAVVYKAIKVDDLSVLPRESAQLAAQISGLMALAAGALWLLTHWL